MKTFNKLYETLCSLENLQLAFKKAKRGKLKKWYVKKFEKNLEAELFKMKGELENFFYQPRPLKRFVIRDPKTRVIHASAFRDRVVHHAVCNLIEPIFEKTFIQDSYASRKGKGSHKALFRLDEFKRKASRSGRLVSGAKDNNMVVGFFLKADIKHYFDTVDHEVLMRIIKKKISDKKVLRLIKIILDAGAKSSGKGMPIGNLTSQVFANVYLNELDYFVKQKLKEKFYLRYLDDFIIFGNSKKALEDLKWKISQFLKIIKLELHPDKSKIYPIHNGIAFVGYRIFYNHRLLRKSSLKKFEKNMASLKENAEQEQIKKIIAGWYGYAIWANTFNFRNKLNFLIPQNKGCRELRKLSTAPQLIFHSSKVIKSDNHKQTE